jgi:hypothetical protein
MKDPKNPTHLLNIFKHVQHAVTDATGKVKNAKKKKLLQAMKQKITGGSDNFAIIRLDESYREFVFDTSFDEITMLLDYHITVKPGSAGTFPYMFITPKIPVNGFAFVKHFVKFRGKKPNKLLMEVGATMNLLSDKNFSNFVVKEVKNYKDDYVFSDSIAALYQYKGIVANMQSNLMV